MLTPLARPSVAVLSVSELTREIARLRSDRWPKVWVQGEISNFLHHTSGHMYFTLKDADSQLRCCLFRNAGARLRMELRNGMEVVCCGAISVYSRRGEYQLVVEQLMPVGAGALQLAFERLKERLHKEGLFDTGRKKNLPPYPRRIGIITSPNGAAIRDILNVLGRRSAGVSVLIFPASVQGDTAESELCAALRRAVRIAARLKDLDVLILTRGGGSLEDLWPFNSEELARLMAVCPLPTISAVGHEVDFTICDFVADLRAPTPSAAAELVVRDRREVAARVTAHSVRMGQAMRHRVAETRMRVTALRERFRLFRFNLERRALFLDDLTQSLAAGIRGRLLVSRQQLELLGGRLVHPRQRLYHARIAVGLLMERLRAAMHGVLRRERDRTGMRMAQLDALSPLKVLERGYSILLTQATLGDTVGAVRDARQLREDQPLRAILHRGSADLRVVRTIPAELD